MFHQYLKFPLGSVSARGFSSVLKKENVLQSCSISGWHFLLEGAVLRCELLVKGRIVTVCLRAGCQTGINESIYALAVWNTAVLKSMLVHLYKIYSRLSWIRNYTEVLDRELLCVLVTGSGAVLGPPGLHSARNSTYCFILHGTCDTTETINANTNKKQGGTVLCCNLLVSAARAGDRSVWG